MRNRKQNDDYSTRSAPQPERLRLIDEARALYTRYADYAVQDIKQSHAAENGAKPLWLKMANVIGIVAVVAVAVILAFGIFTWPDAPIRQTPNGFAGKTGLAHAREDYELFKQWEKLLFASAPFAFIVNVVVAVVTKRRREHQGLES